MTLEYKVPFLDYYGAHNISPVRQDISNLAKHFERRCALFRQCGIVPGLLKGRSILEVGPGTGHNALYTHSLGPERYLLLDGNPKSVESCRELLSEYYPDDPKIQVIQCNFDKFESQELFDFVCCEGVITLQLEPSKFLEKLASFVAPSGCIMISTIDHVSMLAERLRAVSAHLMVKDKDFTEQQKVDYLKPVGERSTRHLKGMSRPVEDWLYDNILQPMIGQLFSFSEAIETLDHDFYFHGSNPNLVMDWRWYKDIHGEALGNNKALDSYYTNLHNFLDYRFEFAPREASKNRNLLEKAVEMYELTREIQKHTDVAELVESLMLRLQEFSLNVADFSSVTAESIAEFSEALDNWLKTGSFNDELSLFEPWFGRGQQYISFIRR